MPGHSPGIGLPYDPERGGHLLAEAGYPGGQGFPVIECLTVDSPVVARPLEHLQAQWLKNLGVEITWKRVEFQKLVRTVYEAAPRMWAMGWQSDYPDPDSFLRASEWRFSSGWRNEAYDNLVQGARRVTDQKERMRMYQRADKILVEEAPIIPLLYSRFHMLMKPWVRSYPISPQRLWFWKDVIIEPH
jgi:oligopeptide transport system substrate-binding protein